ncbi:MAG: 50S ribosomal protein L3 N(5)-glutamine methyltransferase [Verrucomicrobia bacterium]|nr:50S ribosomal protein L3 N(5)-glutamine methyltransferase [Verrucomicrobiota bacterium]
MKNLEKSEDIFAGTQVLVTLRDWTRFAVSLFSKSGLFFGQGMSTAYDEAVYLLCHTLGLPTDGGAETFFDAKLTPNEIAEIKSVLTRRALERVPAAYITREAWLGNYRFYVDERTIVPRSYFTEMIPEKMLPWIPGMDVEAVERIADVCTGGGSIAILLAEAFPNAAVDACDISDAALEVARKNVSDYGLENRISLWKSDVLDGVPAEDASYDIIVSNPPYEPEELRATLPEEFRKEPDNALFSGADGLDVIRRLLPQAAKKLKRNGALFIEVGGLQDALAEAFPQLEISWLETADGSDCICAISASSLREVFA